MLKLFYLFLFIFLGCENYHDKSFVQLNKAFDNWYVESNKTNLVLLERTNNFFLKYDKNSIDNHLGDLHRFNLELTQINLNKLSVVNKKYYYAILNKINYDIFKYSTTKSYQKDPYHYLNDIQLLLESINSDNFFITSDKILIINNIVDEMEYFLDESKIILNNDFFNIDRCKRKKDEILSYLTLLIESYHKVNYNNDFKTDELIIHEILRILPNKAEKILSSYLEWLNDNTVNDYFVSNNETYIEFIHNQFFNKTYYNNILNKLNLDINDIYLRLFNLSLSLYLLENDEPVWVDNEDSLNVIKWGIDYSNIKYNSTDFNNYSNHIFDLFDIVVLDSLMYEAKMDFIRYKTLDYNKYNLDDILISLEFQDYYNSTLSSTNEFNYINEYYSNAFVDILKNYSILKKSNKKDIYFEVLFYLNLYQKFNQIYYQDKYLNGRFSLEDINDEISNISILNNNQKEEVLEGLTHDYFMLYEYMLYLNIYGNLDEDVDLYNRGQLIEFFYDNINIKFQE